MQLLRPARFHAVLFASFVVAVPAVAHAQKADVNVQAGVSKRFLSEGTLNGNVGGLVGVQAHVALVPLVRIGAYIDEELAPTGEPKPRTITSFGARLKLTPPWPRDDFRIWAFTGFGYAAVSAPGYTQAIGGPNGTTDQATASAAGGGFFEVPVGIGGAWRVAKPWELVFELSGRVGFGMSGSYYDPTGRPGVDPQQQNLAIGLGPAGNDTFGLFLTAGVGLDL